MHHFTKPSGNREILFLLTSMIVLLFIIYPLVDNSELSSYLTNVFILFVLIIGVLSIDIKPRNKKIFIIFVIAILILGRIGEAYEQNFIIHIHVISRLVFLWILVILIFAKVFNNSEITFFYRIAGSITVYLLIGFIWANMYFIFYLLYPDAFHFSVPLNPEHNLMSNFIYFSFENLTTLGYGDMLPLYPLLKSFVLLEAIIGPLYLAILIGRLVSKRRIKE